MRRDNGPDIDEEPGRAGRATSALAALVDLCGRLLLTHVIDLELAARATGLDLAALTRARDSGQLSDLPAAPVAHERLTLFVNILVRLEVRCRHDSRLLRAALLRLFADGAGRPLDLGRDAVSTLRQLRADVETLDLPAERWWRVGHR